MKKDNIRITEKNIDPEAYYNILYNRINEDLANAVSVEFPPNLYNPMRYALATRGKRFRPILLIMACESVGGTFRDAYNASLAIEILHNFTLIHDDIMDDDNLRRGNATVHKKWNTSIAILAGDGLIALAYRFLLRTKSRQIKRIIKIFSEAIIVICEGQSIDKDMESAASVSMNDYFDMIKRKTGVLVSISAELGGILGRGSKKEIEALSKFGFELGIAYQIQDDLLDIISEEIIIGKDLGSDLAQGKKTFPIIAFADCASKRDIQYLNETFLNGNADLESIRCVKKMLHDYGIVEKTQQEVNKHIDKANSYIHNTSNNYLLFLSAMIRNRKF